MSPAAGSAEFEAPRSRGERKSPKKLKKKPKRQSAPEAAKAEGVGADASWWDDSWHWFGLGLCGAVTPFTLASLTIPDWTGSLGHTLASTLYGSCGISALLLPGLSTSLGLYFLLPRAKRPLQLSWGPALLCLDLMWLSQRMGGQGGSVGAAIDGLAVAAVGPMGSWMGASLGLLASALAVCRVPLTRAVKLATGGLASGADAVFKRAGQAKLPSLPSLPSRADWASVESDLPRALPEPRLLSVETPAPVVIVPEPARVVSPPVPVQVVEAPAAAPVVVSTPVAAPPVVRAPVYLPPPPPPQDDEDDEDLWDDEVVEPSAEDTPAGFRSLESDEFVPLLPTVNEAPLQFQPEHTLVERSPSIEETYLETPAVEGKPDAVEVELEPPAPVTEHNPDLFVDPDGQYRLFAETSRPVAVDYQLPSIALLNEIPLSHQRPKVEDKSEHLLDALASFGVQASLLAIVQGPTVTRYELQPARGVKVSRFTSLTNDIALALAAKAVRIEAPIPGKSAIGIEIPNEQTELVVLRDILAAPKFRKSTGMSIALGKDLSGTPTFAALQKMPHLLVAGTTGSGKSVCVNGLIMSLLYRFTPRELQLLMIDPKQVELSIYEGIPHLITLAKTGDSKNEGAIICEPKRAAMALHQVVELMEHRYSLFASARVRNLDEFNESGEDPLPWVVVIIDELADLMMVASKSVETSICRIAQKARAAGIHLVLATQRPSADVITGLIKVNVPSRIAFAVSSQVDSRVILDTGGAEQLLGKGDMLFCPVDASDPRRIQGCYVTNEEILRVVEWWRAQAAPDNLIQLKVSDVPEEGAGDEEESSEDDQLVEQALQVVLRRQQASASLLQTELKVGYARARRLIYLMEKKGYIGPAEGSKPRKILAPQG